MKIRALQSALVATALAAALPMSWAQNAGQVQQGSDFAKQIAPTSPSQIVNPAAVSPNIWTSTSVPVAVPPQLGGFSTPVTSSAALTAAKNAGLTSYGNSAMDACANFVPTPTSDPLRVQECAAMNFLANRCLSPTTTQGGVLAKLGQTQQPGNNCQGTYGQGAATFGFGNQVNANDPMFGTMNSIKTTAGSSVGQQCTTKTVITKPAQYQTEVCVKNGQAEVQTCSQYMNVTIVTNTTAAHETDTCATGTLIGGYCVATSTGQPHATYACPSGSTLVGEQCEGPTGVTPAILVNYNCPAGQTLAGTVCVAEVNTDDGAAGTAYTCPPGATLTGQLCTATATGSPTYPLGGFCQDGYGNIPQDWSISGNTCSMWWDLSQETPDTKAVDYVPGCPALTEFVTKVVGITINTTSVYRNGDCKFVTNVGGNGRMYCPLPDPLKYVLKNQVGAAPMPGYAMVSPNECSYVPATQYSCPSGETIDVNNQCHGGTTTTAIVTSYFCPTGGAYVNGQCVKTTQTSATVTYSCPAGDTVVSGRCMKTTTVTEPATPNYSCPNGGTVSGSNCLTPGGMTPANVTYSCLAPAVLQNNMCVTTTTVPATIEYSCIDGSAPVAGFCVIKSADISWTDTCGPYETSAGAPLPPP